MDLVRIWLWFMTEKEMSTPLSFCCTDIQLVWLFTFNSNDWGTFNSSMASNLVETLDYIHDSIISHSDIIGYLYASCNPLCY